MKLLLRFINLIPLFILIVAFIPSVASSADEGECQIPLALSDFGKDLFNNNDLKTAFEGSTPDKLDDLYNAWNELKNHDVRLNFDFLQKVASLPPEKQTKVGILFKDQIAARGKKGKVNYSITKTIDGKTITVQYDKYGFPDFSQFALGPDFTYRSNSLTGGRGIKDIGLTNDMTTANNAMKAKNIPGFKALPGGNVEINGVLYTWHHHQDGKTMFLVPSSIHNSSGGFRHSGGAAVIKKGLQGLFESPISPNI